MTLNPSALSFNGIGHYGKLSTASTIRGLGAFTIAVWFKVGVNALSPNQHAFVERQGTGTLNRLTVTPIKDKLTFNFSPKDGVAPTAYTYTTKWDDRWHHAAFTARLGGSTPSYEIVLDGVSVADGTLVVPSGVTAISDTAPKGVYVGNYSKLASGESFATATAWHGKIDDLIIFNQAVGQGELNDYFASDDHWEIDTDPETTNLKAYYQFNQNSGSTVTDVAVSPARSGSLYNNGTLYAALWVADRPFLGDGLLDTTAPSAPTTNAHTNLTHDGFDTSWSASTDNVFVQFYELQVSQFNNFATYTAYDTGQNLSMPVRGLLPSTNYYWRVRALDAELNASAYSSVRSLTTPSIGDVAPPSPPTNLTSTFLTHSSFRLSFTQSISGDAVGYKLDVATDADFDNILPDYRNQDIGNVTFIDIFGLEGLKSYYARLRTYDAFDNESNDSVALRVNTPRPPDITAPLPATMHAATGVSSRSATLNWAEGIDDTAVLGYYLDVSTDENFSTYVTANSVLWNTVNVGNVTTYRIEGLEPSTTYYYRIRAFDEAGNVAANTDPEQLTTQAASVFEGDVVEVAESMVSWKTGAVVTPAIITVNGSQSARLLFDLTTNVGTIEDVILQFTPRTHTLATTLGNIEIRVTAGNIDTTMTGATLTYNVTQVDVVHEVDITSLFLAGNTTYVVEIASAGFVGHLDSGIPVEVFNDGELAPPLLLIQADPLSSTQPLPFVVTKGYDVPNDRPTLVVQSPYFGDNNDNNAVSISFRHNQDDLWIPVSPTITTNRSLKTHTATLPSIITGYNLMPDPAVEGALFGQGTLDTTVSYSGNQSLKVTNNTGFFNNRIAVTVGSTYTLRAMVKTSEAASARVHIMFYTASTGGSVVGAGIQGNLVYSATDAWELSYATGVVPATATHAAIWLTASSGSAWFDNIQLGAGVLKPYRDGTTLDGKWSGTTNNSSTNLVLLPNTEYHVKFTYTDPDGFMDNSDSLTYEYIEAITTSSKPDNLFTATTLDLVPSGNAIDVTLNYLGDDNNNSTVRFEFKRTDLSTWSEVRPLYDRAARKIRSSVVNLNYGSNYTVRATITDADGVAGAPGGIISNFTITDFLQDNVSDDPHIDFGGFTLMGREDEKIGVTQHDAFGFPLRRVEVEDLPRVDGAYEKQALWSSRSIRMRGFVAGDDRADLANVRSSLVKALAPRQQRLIVDTLGHTGRFYYATCEALDIPERADEHIRHLDWDAHFICADPFAYNLTESNLPTFNASNDSEIALTNNGDVTTNPVLSLTTQHAYPVRFSILNETTGERIAPKTTILNGDRFIIDTDRRSLTKNGVEIDYAGSFPTLASGGNVLVFNLYTTSGVPTLSVDLRWRERFL